MKTRNKYLTVILLVTGIILLLNFLASRYFFRLDFTEDNRYTLSRATKDLLQELTEPVTVKAYFSNNLPPQLDNLRRDFRDMLIEYTQASGGMVVYEFIDPLKEDKEQESAKLLRNTITESLENIYRELRIMTSGFFRRAHYKNSFKMAAEILEEFKKNSSAFEQKYIPKSLAVY